MALSGPILIASGVLVVMRAYVLKPLLHHGDMATYWLPVHCFLGRSLRSGHIPGWNPYAMSGQPFAPDPQAGWMSLPPMALFTALPCGAATRWLSIALVVGAGLAMYWFLRGEDASRLVATVGGLVLALGLASTAMPPNFRFTGSIMWTLLLLGATGKCLRAERLHTRVVWLAVAALCWGQLAAAFLGLGLLVGTATWMAYLGAIVTPKLRSGEWPLRRTAWLLASFVPAFLLVNQAYFLPRIAYSPRISLSLGYGTLSRLSEQLLGEALEFPGTGTGPAWPLNLSLVPGRYLGGVVVLSVAAFWSHRRQLAWAFAGIGAACYLASLQAVVDVVPESIRSWTLVDQYLHRPHRLVFGVFVPMAVLSALGVEAWARARTLRDRVAMLLPGIVVWALIPLALGAPPRRLAFVMVGGAISAGLLLAGRRTPTLVLAVAPLLAFELIASTTFSQPGLMFGPGSNLLRPLAYPLTRQSVVKPTRLARVLAREGEGRYLTIGTERDRQGLHTKNQGMLHGIESTGGYLSVQLARYWLFVRTFSDTPMDRQYALFRQPPSIVLDLLHVNWLIAREGEPAVEPGSQQAARDGPWILYRLPHTVPRASVVFEWEVVGSDDAALRRIATGVDPARVAILEEDPGIEPSPPPEPSGSATYESLGPQAARVVVDVPAPAIVLIRNVFDPNWRAVVDGHPAPVLAADYVVQGVAVPAGRHTIELGYDDPTIGLGLLGSALAIATLVGLAWVLRRRAALWSRSDETASPRWSEGLG